MFMTIRAAVVGAAAPARAKGLAHHVGYIDARANPDASELARHIADENARTFQCDKDKLTVLGQHIRAP
jgi:hypothetical protein